MSPIPTIDCLLSQGLVQRAGSRRLSIARQSVPICSTGIQSLDEAIPEGGLRMGMIHEWFASDPNSEADDNHHGGQHRNTLRRARTLIPSSFWLPPLTIIAAIAARTSERDGGGRGPCLVGPRPTSSHSSHLPLICWIGRRCWPLPTVIPHLLARSIFIDPPDDGARFWAIDQSLRCPEVACVVADAARLDMGGSRRLQLAAESGGTLALLARPVHERRVISAAATRWLVRAAPAGPERAPRWRLVILRCKGSLSSLDQVWTVESEVRDGSLSLRLAPDVADRPGAAASGFQPSLRAACG